MEITPLTDKEVKDINDLYFILAPTFSMMFIPIRQPIIKSLEKAKSKLTEMGI